jgi:hypothetical protein
LRSRRSPTGFLLASTFLRHSVGHLTTEYTDTASAVTAVPSFLINIHEPDDHQLPPDPVDKRCSQRRTKPLAAWIGRRKHGGAAFAKPAKAGARKKGDIGDDALRGRDRPALAAALRQVQRAACEPATDRAVLLVSSEGRLSHDVMNLAGWRYRVERVGGTVVTADRPDATVQHLLAERAANRAPGAGQ